MNALPTPSSVTLGGSPTGAVRSEWVEQSLMSMYKNWWTLQLSGFYIANVDVPATQKHAIVDTGSSLIILTQTDYQPFQQMIQAASSDFYCDNSVNNFCYSDVSTCEVYWPNMKNLTFVLEANEYTIQPESYTLTE